MARNTRGYVYLLSNDSMPNIYKVGYTTNSPFFRASQISNVTACPTPFDVVCFAEFDDAHFKERELHNWFKDYRVNPNKEFFKFTLNDLITWAVYIITSEHESECKKSFLTNKYNHFLTLFHKNVELI